ncbi:mucin-17-like [Lolium rigidum]|uniref:mucin-17-like n=1 Tax=Lolium rigidum TaxID=89674 RepID=UPI001F5C2D25|nr:mucin-17-like [Lolium rigidum]
MKEGVAAAENPTVTMAVPEVAANEGQHAEGSSVPMAMPEESAVVDQHFEGSTVPMAVPAEAAGADQRAEGVTVPMVAPEKASDDSTVSMAVVQEEAAVIDQHFEGSTVPMAVPEEAVGADQRAEGVTVPAPEKAAEDSTVSMVVPEKAADADQHLEGSTVSMVVTEEAVDVDQRGEGLTVSMVVTQEAVDADQHGESSTVSMVVTQEAVDVGQHGEGSTVPMVMQEEAVITDQHIEGVRVPLVVPEAAADADHHIEDANTQYKHGDTDGIINVTPGEMRGIIEVIAETGKFWHEWSFLKRLLSLQLMQVLGEYSEVQMVMREDGQQQNSLSAEAHSELFSQLNDALLRFEEGPPFTLQRLCEILLDPKGTYKKLSKLALALEKTLLVTSTITKCTDPYPVAHGRNSEATAITEITDPVDAKPEKLPEHPAAVSNGTEHAGGDGDEEMADAEAEAGPGSHDDVEMQEEKPDHHMAGVDSHTSSGVATTCGTVGGSEQPLEPQS